MRWFFLLLVLVMRMPAWACSCVSWPTAREAFEDSPLVFVGIIERANISREVEASGFQISTARVREPFKGVKADQEIVLRQPLDSCTARFQEGQELLFYLHPSKGQKDSWTAPGCHRSRQLSHAAGDLLFLREIPRSLEKTRLSGEVSLDDAAQFEKSLKLPGVQVTITGSDGQAVRTITNADGVFEVYGLPEDEYAVQIDVPRNLEVDLIMPTGRSIHRTQRAGHIMLSAAGGAEVDFVLKNNSRVSGRVLDPDGRPMPRVCVDLIRSERSEDDRQRHDFDSVPSKLADQV